MATPRRGRAPSPPGESLAGRVIGVTADRRAAEQIALLRNRGAEVIHAPTMATVDLTADAALRAATEAVVAAPPTWLVVTTGTGMRSWLEAAASMGLDLVGALARAGTRVVARGAKGASVVRQAGLPLEWRAAHETMDEVVDYLTSAVGSRGTAATMAVQLFDPDEHPSTVELRALVGEESLTEVPVYRWRLPAEVAPAQRLVEMIASGEVDAVTFTSQPAVRFLVAIARDMDPARDREMVAAFGAEGVLPVCVGPVCAEACVEAGIEGAVWPEPPRLVPMVRLLEQQLSRD